MLLILSDMSSCPTSTKHVSNIVCHTLVHMGHMSAIQTNVLAVAPASTCAYAAHDACCKGPAETRESVTAASTATAAALCSRGRHATNNAALKEVVYVSVECFFCDLSHAACTDCATVMLQKAVAFTMLHDTPHCSGLLATALLRNSIFVLA